MLTIFSTPKPFCGKIAVIQRNALESWLRLDSEVEVILFGDEKGAAEVSVAMGLHHEPQVSRNEHGTKHLHHIFARAQQLARHPLVCYVNCDIILPHAFAEAARCVATWRERFLMVGRRWDVDITAPLDFDNPQWEPDLLTRAFCRGHQRPAQWIDYFLFSRGLYHDLPPMVIGRVGWDNYLIWRARSKGACVVDASEAVTAVHQNHDYAYHPQGEYGVWNDEQAQHNIVLAGGPSRLYTLEDATYCMTPRGIQRRLLYFLAPCRRRARQLRHHTWHRLLALTRPLRHQLGIRQSILQRLAGRVAEKRDG